MGSARRAWSSALTVAAVLALAPVGASAVGANAPAERLGRAGPSTTVSAVRGSLSATMTAPRSVRRGATFALAVTYDDPVASGAVGPSTIRFGDGSRRSFAQPQFCRARPGPVRGTTRFTHRYSRTGSYRVTLDVVADCTAAPVVRLAVTVRAVS
ncbi:MAG TPA: hypothetical protein VGL60_00465 [Acidimicrobiales bacterium]